MPPLPPSLKTHWPRRTSNAELKQRAVGQEIRKDRLGHENAHRLRILDPRCLRRQRAYPEPDTDGMRDQTEKRQDMAA